MGNIDDEFWDRADAHINLSNSQISEAVAPGKVSASHMYSMARFAAWLTFTGFNSVDEMKEKHSESVDYFVSEFKKMLEENFSDYEDNFEKYKSG